MSIEKLFNSSNPGPRIAVILPLIMGTAMLSYGEVVYENDFATATPAVPIETFTGIKYRRAPQVIKGISSLCILGQGTTDNTLDNSVGAFWDNIRIDYTPPGMNIIFR